MDGVGAPTTRLEGAFAPRPALDLGDLHLPKLTRMIVRAAQRSALVVRDQTGHAISLFAENPPPFRGNLYPSYLKGGTPQEWLANFPSDRLQVVKIDLWTTAPCRRTS